MSEDIGQLIQTLQPLNRELFESAGIPVTEKAVPIMPTERPNTRSWNEWAALINGAWRKGSEPIIETGKQLIAAKEELPRDEFESIIKLKLAFDASVARKLICIACNPIICAHGHKLPPCWTVIYDLSKLDHDTLLTGIKDGRVHPGMQRKDVRILAGKPEPKRSKGAEPPPVAITEEAINQWLTQADPEAKQRIRRQALADIGEQELRAILPALPQTTCNALVEHCFGQEIASANSSSNLAVTLTALWRNVSASEMDSIPALAAIERKLKTNRRDRCDTVIALVSTAVKAKRARAKR
jgi:hypothetical protein